MTTIGYGDWIPITPLGRVSGVLASFSGLILTSILISAVMNMFSLDEQVPSVIMT